MNEMMAQKQENQIEIFKNPEFGSVRLVEENGKYLFCGTDVAAALGYSNPRDALRRHCKGVVKRDTPTDGGPQQLSFIPEGDVYRLITHSNLPSAEQFECWVFDEVLPSIRKSGGYIQGQDSLSDEELVQRAFLVVHKQLEERTAQVEALTAENAQLRPDAEYANECLKAKNCVKTMVIAKELGMSAERLNEILRLLNVQYKRGNQWFLKSKYQNKGYTDVQTALLHHQDGTTEVGTITVWTQQGKRFIIELLKKHGYIDHKRLTAKAAGTKCRKCSVPYFNGERMRKQMEARGISMNALSRMTGIGRNTLVQYRDGKVWPVKARRDWICLALGVPKTYFDN